MKIVVTTEAAALSIHPDILCQSHSCSVGGLDRHGHVLHFDMCPIRIRHGTSGFLLAVSGVLRPAGKYPLDLYGRG